MNLTLGAITDITYASTPDYDDWGPDTYWGCAEWQYWHQQLVKEYGKTKANAIFKQAWDKQGSFDYALNACRYNSDFVNYFLKQGLDLRSFISAIIINTTEAAVNTTDAAAQATDSAANVAKFLPYVLVAVGVGVGIYYFKELKSIISHGNNK